MKKFYDDFKLLNESKLMQMANEYSQRLSKIKTLSADNYNEKISRLKNFLIDAEHYLNNLINLSANKEILGILSEIKEEIKKYIEEINILFDISVAENIEEQQNALNFENNKMQLINSIINFICELFDCINIEDNLKIKSALENIFYGLIEMLKRINEIKIDRIKIFSFFKRN